MKAWKLSTSALPPTERQAAWERALSSLSLSVAGPCDDPQFAGSASCARTRHGSEYVHLSCSAARQIAFAESDAGTLVCALVIEGWGEARQHDGARDAVVAGDLVVGPIRADAGFGFASAFRLLMIRMPRPLIEARTLAPLADRLDVIRQDGAFASIFHAMVEALAQRVHQLDTDQIHSLECAISELLATSILSAGGASARGGSEGRKATMLQRVLQGIERRLMEPALSLATVAHDNGLSVRSLQKLFSASDQTFSGYLRARRLERCRRDLSSDYARQLSISEICYRWGFTDPAYFSRAFRSEFGLPPREFRRSRTRRAQADQRFMGHANRLLADPLPAASNDRVSSERRRFAD